ncbi:MAG: hypothetical protein U1E49_13155 [Hyphomicrobiaceae bacterium]
MRVRKTSKFIHEGRYAAEVAVDLIETDHEWAPYLSLDDVEKLEAVRKALRSGDIASAAKLSKVYEMTPVAAE